MPKNCAAIVIAAKHSELIKVKDASGVTNTIGALRCKFEFRTAEWDESVRTAVFCKGNMSTHPGIVNTAISVPLDSVDECAVPAEVLLPGAKYFSVGLWGVTSAGLRVVSKWLVFRIEDGCYVDSTEPIPPDPSIYEQIMLSLNSKAPVDHKHDDIYYTKEEVNEIIEENSFGGGSTGGVVVETDPTVPDWAKQPQKPEYNASEILYTNENLSNEDGTIKSAFDEAITYINTKIPKLQDEIDDIKIPTKVSELENDENYVVETELQNKVDSALEVAKSNGEFDGKDGQDGADGLSAYQIWLNAGNTGSETDFLVSLKGIKGDKGETGKDGNDGVSVASIEQTTTSTTDGGINIVTITLSNGATSTFNIKNGSKGNTGINGQNGADGKTPIKGVDYFTEEDKSELVNDILSTLPTWSGGAY